MKALNNAPPAGKRIHVEGTRGVRVPMRKIEIQEPNPSVTLYDTSGPYGDPGYTPDLDRGLPLLREKWILERGDVEKAPHSNGRNVFRAASGKRPTQMHYARKGIITPEMEFIAIREGMDPEKVRDEIAAGRPSSPPTSTTPSPNR